MRLREADGVLGKQDAYPFDPRKLKIKPGYNVRDLDSPDERAALDELKASIKERGVEEPLKVQVDGDDVFIIRGHRRHRAAMELIDEGHEVPNVLVFQMPRGMNDADLNLDIIAGNDNRKDLTRLQYAEVIRRQHVVYKWDLDRIAKALGKTIGAINNALNMAELPEDVKTQVDQKIVSATEAVKVVKETRDAKTDPAFAAKLIQDAADEQKRLGKRGKATPKALTAAKERAKPKPLAETKAPEPAIDAAELDASAPLQSETGAPVEGAQSLDQLNEQIEAMTAKPDHDAAAEQRRRDQEFEAAAPKSATKGDTLIFQFVSASVTDLAAMRRKLDAETEQTAADGGDISKQRNLLNIADEIGEFHFGDDWWQARNNSELDRVA